MKHISEFINEGLRELFEERAGIVEFDGGKTREEAERAAQCEIDKRRLDAEDFSVMAEYD